MSRQVIRVALAGNPNSGKTSVFNSLTGARQHVGNYPGVTVEKKEGSCRHGDVDIHIVDLPGTYSLTAYTLDEVVARNHIISERPDVVINILDASNLERNLYLTTQLMELDVPLVLALNMSDVAQARGIEFDLATLSGLLGAPIMPTIGHRGQGMTELLDATIAVAGGERGHHVEIHYGREIEEEIGKIEGMLDRRDVAVDQCETRWLATKLLEHDKEIRDRIDDPKIDAAIDKSIAHLQRIYGDPPEIVIADRRYGFISGACQEAVRATVEARHTMSDRIDAVVTNRVLAIPLFLALMYLAFHLTFALGEAPMGWLELFFSWLGDTIASWWPKGVESPLKSLLVDGIVGGVGGVLIFLPNILLLFLAIAVLEDSGYMARAAFIMDRLMHKIGLHGKSFIPMLIGFGCSVPAIMATRTLEDRKDRLTTIMVTPLMSCGARLPIYALIIPAFFPAAWRAPMLWGIYLLGIILAVVLAKLLRKTVFKGADTPFVMELPPWRMPTLKGVLIHMWERGWLYLRKAGTIILGASFILWALTSYPKPTAYTSDYDGATTQAREDYLAAVHSLNAVLGLPEKSDLLSGAVRAELIAEAEQGRYWESEPGFAAAEREKAGAISLLIRQPSGEALKSFLDTRDAMGAALAEFETALADGDIEADSIAHLALAHRRDEILAALKETHARAYAAAVQYFDNAHAPFIRTMMEIDQSRHAEDMAGTVAGRIGHAIEPALRPMGFDWRIGTALIGATAAKEIFVAQLGVVYAVGGEREALRARLREDYNPLIGFCIMVFCLITAPCVATIAVTKQETNSWKWALFQLTLLTATAYVVTVVLYQAGLLLRIGVG